MKKKIVMEIQAMHIAIEIINKAKNKLIRDSSDALIINMYLKHESGKYGELSLCEK